MKKSLRIALFILTLSNGLIYAQPNFDPNKGRTCGTEIPSTAWVNDFNKAVDFLNLLPQSLTAED